MVITKWLASSALALWICGAALANGIYTCVDGHGRKITADRPISECADRTQHEITPTGTVMRVIGPTLTAQERTANEETEKLVAEQRAQAQEVKRRDRALLLRYPTPQLHDQERGLALAQVDEVIKASASRSQDLAVQRTGLNTEMEFYKKTPGKAPPPLKRKLDENDSSVAAQKRFLLEQEIEKRRINLRFDEERLKLTQLWAAANVPVAGNAAASSVRSVKNASRN